MQYYGNLALREERKQVQPAPKRNGQQAPRPRRRTIPVGEKLLYLLIVIVFVAVSSLVVYRYASLYQLNRQIQVTSNQYDQAVQQSKELQREIEKLKDPSRIQQMALQYGLVPLQEQPITLPSADGKTPAAEQP